MKDRVFSVRSLAVRQGRHPLRALAYARPSHTE